MAKRRAVKSPPQLYTYRGGERVPLAKRADQFVVRRLPDELPTAMAGAEQVSSASARITCDSGELEGMMAHARDMAPTHHAYEIEDTGEAFLITDRIIVTFREVPDIETVGAFAGRYALEIVERITARDYLFRLTDATGMNPVKLVVKLTEAEDAIENVDHDLNMVFRTNQLALPSDPLYPQQWHLHRRHTPSTQYDPRSSAQCEAAWRLLDHFGSHDVVVGITDDGCQIDHPDFDSPDKFAGWGYFEGIRLVRRGDPGASATQMYVQGSNHGTACAGVVAAEIDGELTVGAAPGVRLLPIRWPSDGPSLFIGDTRLRRALEYMETRVDVASNSWGSTPVSTWAGTTLAVVDRLARTGGRRGTGIVFLWAAGNENCPLSHQANVDVPFTSGWEVFRDASGQALRRWAGVDTARTFRNDLAGRDGVVHVAALASNAQRSHYSNYGTGIGLCAPSSNLHKYLRLDLPGLGITTTEGLDAVTASFGGTSSATPLVAGIAALVISANPELSALEVISVLKSTASKDLDTTDWPRTPPASYDRDPTWDVSPVAPFDDGTFAEQGLPDGTWSPWFGHGRVDAEAAVRGALALAGERTVRVSATANPGLPIPDRDPVGVVSRLAVTERGTIQSLAVRVDITHTWIGDLVVTLMGPGGERAILHQRAGNGADDIVRVYDGAAVPALAGFNGTEVAGVWTLEVADHASADVGRLNRWSVEAQVIASGEARQESTTAAQIPDNDPAGVTSTIAVTDDRIITEVAVEVDVTHSWRGDLRISLAAPGGQTVVLHERAGGSADNVVGTFTAADTPALAVLQGQRAAGTWTLTVADLARADVGKLNRWALMVR